ncbi:unnamed protein product [Amoebophrya sp. A120]|nr:unnamed protein product [Amoebophrya sp. A120]|eukprot:GSA120T00013838001.1
MLRWCRRKRTSGRPLLSPVQTTATGRFLSVSTRTKKTTRIDLANIYLEKTFLHVVLLALVLVLLLAGGPRPSEVNRNLDRIHGVEEHVEHSTASTSSRTTTTPGATKTATVQLFARALSLTVVEKHKRSRKSRLIQDEQTAISSTPAQQQQQVEQQHRINSGRKKIAIGGPVNKNGRRSSRVLPDRRTRMVASSGASSENKVFLQHNPDDTAIALSKARTTSVVEQLEDGRDEHGREDQEHLVHDPRTSRRRTTASQDDETIPAAGVDVEPPEPPGPAEIVVEEHPPQPQGRGHEQNLNFLEQNQKQKQGKDVVDLSPPSCCGDLLGTAPAQDDHSSHQLIAFRNKSHVPPPPAAKKSSNDGDNKSVGGLGQGRDVSKKEFEAVQDIQALLLNNTWGAPSQEGLSLGPLHDFGYTCGCEHGFPATGAACTEPHGNICASCHDEGTVNYLANKICYPINHPRPKAGRWLPDTDDLFQNQNIQPLPAHMEDPCRYGKDQYGKTGTREHWQTLEAGVRVRGTSVRKNKWAWPGNDHLNLEDYLNDVWEANQVCFGGYGDDGASKRNEDIVGEFVIPSEVADRGAVSQVTLVHKKGKIACADSTNFGSCKLDQWASLNDGKAGVFLSRDDLAGNPVLAPFPDMYRFVDPQTDWFQPAQSFRFVPQTNENGRLAYAVLREGEPNGNGHFADELHFRGETGVGASVFTFPTGVKYHLQQGENWRGMVDRAGDNKGIVCVDVVVCMAIPFSNGFPECHVGYHFNSLPSLQNTCEPNVCHCNNGQGAEGTACVPHGAHVCTSCKNDNYALDDTTKKCVKQCTCDNGTVAGADACEAAGDNTFQVCSACNAGYHLNVITNLCDENQCTCRNPNFSGTTNTACPVHDTEVCESCLTECGGNYGQCDLCNAARPLNSNWDMACCANSGSGGTATGDDDNHCARVIEFPVADNYDFQNSGGGTDDLPPECVPTYFKLTGQTMSPPAGSAPVPLTLELSPLHNERAWVSEGHLGCWRSCRDRAGYCDSCQVTAGPDFSSYEGACCEYSQDEITGQLQPAVLDSDNQIRRECNILPAINWSEVGKKFVAFSGYPACVAVPNWVRTPSCLAEELCGADGEGKLCNNCMSFFIAEAGGNQNAVFGKSAACCSRANTAAYNNGIEDHNVCANAGSYPIADRVADSSFWQPECVLMDLVCVDPGTHPSGGQCVPNECTCPTGGKGATGAACPVHGQELCDTCNDGYHMKPGSTSCDENVCSCDNGIGATGVECVTPGPFCTSCNPGYHKNVNNFCVINVCTCTNGSGAHGLPDCIAHGAEQCAVCENEGFHLLTREMSREDFIAAAAGPNSADSDNSASDLFYRRTCEQNLCYCTNGTAAEGANCTQNNTEICTDCDDPGYFLNTTTTANGTITMTSCDLKECTCGNGGVAASGISCPVNGMDKCESCTEAEGYHMENVTVIVAVGAANDTDIENNAEVDVAQPEDGNLHIDLASNSLEADVAELEQQEAGLSSNETTTESLQNSSSNAATERTFVSQICVLNQCLCAGGTAATGTDCAENGTEVCVACDEEKGFGFDKENDVNSPRICVLTSTTSTTSSTSQKEHIIEDETTTTTQPPATTEEPKNNVTVAPAETDENAAEKEDTSGCCLLLVFLILALIIAIGIAVYFLFFADSATEENDSEEERRRNRNKRSRDKKKNNRDDDSTTTDTILTFGVIERAFLNAGFAGQYATDLAKQVVFDERCEDDEEVLKPETSSNDAQILSRVKSLLPSSSVDTTNERKSSSSSSLRVGKLRRFLRGLLRAQKPKWRAEQLALPSRKSSFEDHSKMDSNASLDLENATKGGVTLLTKKQARRVVHQNLGYSDEFAAYAAGKLAKTAERAEMYQLAQLVDTGEELQKWHWEDYVDSKSKDNEDESLMRAFAKAVAEMEENRKSRMLKSRNNKQKDHKNARPQVSIHPEFDFDIADFTVDDARFRLESNIGLSEKMAAFLAPKLVKKAREVVYEGAYVIVGGSKDGGSGTGSNGSSGSNAAASTMNRLPRFAKLAFRSSTSKQDHSADWENWEKHCEKADRKLMKDAIEKRKKSSKDEHQEVSSSDSDSKRKNADDSHSEKASLLKEFFTSVYFRHRKEQQRKNKHLTGFALDLFGESTRSGDGDTTSKTSAVVVHSKDLHHVKHQGSKDKKDDVRDKDHGHDHDHNSDRKSKVVVIKRKSSDDYVVDPGKSKLTKKSGDHATSDEEANKSRKDNRKSKSRTTKSNISDFSSFGTNTSSVASTNTADSHDSSDRTKGKKKKDKDKKPGVKRSFLKSKIQATGAIVGVGASAAASSTSARGTKIKKSDISRDSDNSKNTADGDTTDNDDNQDITVKVRDGTSLANASFGTKKKKKKSNNPILSFSGSPPGGNTPDHTDQEKQGADSDKSNSAQGPPQDEVTLQFRAELALVDIGFGPAQAKALAHRLAAMEDKDDENQNASLTTEEKNIASKGLHVNTKIQDFHQLANELVAKKQFFFERPLTPGEKAEIEKRRKQPGHSGTLDADPTHSRKSRKPHQLPTDAGVILPLSMLGKSVKNKGRLLKKRTLSKKNSPSNIGMIIKGAEGEEGGPAGDRGDPPSSP